MLETIFNPENAVFSFINKLLDLMMLSLVWFVCCLPVVTIGPAMAALYYAVVKTVRKERSYAVREFWKAFRDNLKQGILFQLVIIVFGLLILWTDLPLMLTFWNTEKTADTVLLILLAAKLFLYLGMFCWVYPLMSRFREKSLKLAEAALYLLLKYLPVSLGVIVLLGISVMLLIWEPLFVVIVPGTAVLFASFMIEPALKKLCGKQEKEE